MSQKETDLSAENRIKRGVHAIINIISQIFARIPLSPILFNCFVKARNVEALEIIIKNFLHI